MPRHVSERRGFFNSFPPVQNGHHFADGIFICIFVLKSFISSNFTEVCSQRSNWQYPIIGLDNGLAPNRRQAIICTNTDPIHWRIYAALGGDELYERNAYYISDVMQNLYKTVYISKNIGFV